MSRSSGSKTGQNRSGAYRFYRYMSKNPTAEHWRVTKRRFVGETLKGLQSKMDSAETAGRHGHPDQPGFKASLYSGNVYGRGHSKFSGCRTAVWHPEAFREMAEAIHTYGIYVSEAIGKRAHTWFRNRFETAPGIAERAAIPAAHFRRAAFSSTPDP